MSVLTVGEEFAEFFLSEPDLFPGRSAGEPWGRRELLIDWAGGPYRIRGLSDDQANLLGERYANWILDAGEERPGEVRVQVFRASSSDFRPFDWRNWDQRFDLDPERDLVRLAGWFFFSRIELTPFVDVAIWTSPGPHEQTFVGSVENTLRVVTAHRTLAAGGALLHSAGIRTAGGALLFPGRSGAGKTTICRLAHAKGLQILSDELNVLWRKPDRLEVERLPFAGDFGLGEGGRECVPLSGLFLLRQGQTAQLESVGSAAATAEIAAACPFVNVDPHRTDRLFDNLEKIVQGLEVRILTFDLDATFWRILPTA